jgi:acyl-CoA synthetase (AMP-forming)/AMP-acid ligase II
MDVAESPVPWQTLPEMILDNAARYADHETVVDANTRLTYRDLAERAGAFAAALRQRGFRPGDRLAVWSPNSWRWVVAACGAWLAGGVVVPLSTRARGLEAAEILSRVECTVLCVRGTFLGADYLAMLRGELGDGRPGRPFAGLPSLSTVVLLDDDPSGADFPTIEELIRDGHAAPITSAAQAARNGDDIAEILFTSGTTGRSKGVLLGHRQLLEAFSDYGTTTGMRTGDRYLAVMPFGHGGGMNGCMTTSLIHGLTIVPRAVFNPAVILETVERERITVLLGPPQLFLLTLASSPESRRILSSLRVAITGAASVPGSLMSTLRDEIGVQRVVNAYGLIEATCTVSMTREDDPLEVITTTAGRPMPRVEVRIVGTDGRPVPDGEPGEVLVRGYLVMKGYLDAGKFTEAVDEDGWLHTGDIAVRDDRGNLRIVDRLKDMLIVGGFNAYPAEIENLVMRRGDIKSVAVFGMPDERLGEVPCAVVVPIDRSSFDVDEFKNWCRTSLSNFKVPRRVILADELPVNATGKVDKRLLRSSVLAGTLGSGR